MARLAALLTLTATACSLLTVRGPSELQQTSEPPRCTRNAGFPVAIDALLAAALTPMALFAAKSDATTSDQVSAIGVGLVGVTFAASAVVGYRRSDDCAQSWDAFESSGRR